MILQLEKENLGRWWAADASKDSSKLSLGNKEMMKQGALEKGEVWTFGNFDLGHGLVDKQADKAWKIMDQKALVRQSKAAIACAGIWR